MSKTLYFQKGITFQAGITDGWVAIWEGHRSFDTVASSVLSVRLFNS